MVSNKQVDSNHRKHRRSSSPSDKANKPSKWLKDRHHHRHHRDEEPQYGDDEMAVTEEGEISEKKLEFDGESGEVKSGQFRDNDAIVRVDTLPDDVIANDRYPSEKVGKKSYENGRRSPSNTKRTAEVRIRSRSRSRDRDRERSKSQIATEDGPAVRGRHRDSSRDYSHGWKEEKYYRRGHSKEDDRRLSREVLERERSRRRDRGSDLRKEREWEELEADRGRGKERRSVDRDNGRGRREDYNKGTEIQSDGEKRQSLDDGYGKVRDKQCGHSRGDAEDDLEIRSSDSVKGHNPRGGNSKETSGNVESRSRNDIDDNKDVVIWELVDQEDEELKILEKSRKKMQDIMEKYKKKSEQQIGFSSPDKGKGVPKQASIVEDVTGSGSVGHVASAVNQTKTGFENDANAIDCDHVAKLSSTVEESPARLVISGSDRTLASEGLGEGRSKSERADDMFSDDIFGESPADTRKMGYLRGKGNGLPIVRSGLHDNWDDVEGYYSYQFGELLDGRYEIMATHGKGVFSTVVRAKDTKAELAEPDEVAIKMIRNNETMHKAGLTEVQILKKLTGSDPENKRHCVRFLSSFKYRNHLCLVFESLHMNLREVLKKFGRNIGLKLSAIRLYANQLFISLKHLKNCGVLHCDIKPDNMLVNVDNNVLKLCDFGSAMFAGKNEVTPYLVSRFYRAPEIILGLSYDHPLDIWSVGCCLYELYSGKVLFPGSTNNDMLRLHMELKGPFSKKMLRKGAFINQHFDQDLSFHATEEDSVTGKTIKRKMVNIKPKDFGSVIKGYAGEDPKVLVHFRDLMDKIFILDPGKRLTVSQALAHPFITGK